jgi:hypothetical protein
LPDYLTTFFSFLLVFVLQIQGVGQVSDISQSQPKKIKLQSGDLLFLDLDCGPLCDAIESVTKGYNNQKFSHVGMVCLRNDSSFVIEAIGNSVRLTWLPNFLKYSTKPALIGRLKNQNLVPKAMDFSVSKLGVPYDDNFLYDNGKYYCSELLYDAFREANGGKPVFKLEPMTYKKVGTNEFEPAWVEYFKKLGTEIPEGKPGCNPGGISLAKELTILGEFHTDFESK